MAIFVLAAISFPAQSAPRMDQQTVDRRVDEIVNHALQQGKSVTADGVQVRSMRVDVSLDEEKEIINYGVLAVPPLRKLLDAEEYPAQILSVSLLDQIGGKPALPPLRYAAEKCAFLRRTPERSSWSRPSALGRSKRRDLAHSNRMIKMAKSEKRPRRRLQSIISNRRRNAFCRDTYSRLSFNSVAPVLFCRPCILVPGSNSRSSDSRSSSLLGAFPQDPRLIAADFE